MNPMPTVNDPYRLEINAAFLFNAQPFRGELEFGVRGETRGFRAGASFAQDLWSPEGHRSSLFFNLGYRHYFNRHHAFQMEASVGGDVTGAGNPSTLYRLEAAYIWFPNEDQNLGFSVFARGGAEVFSIPLQEEARQVWMGGLSVIWGWPGSEETSFRRRTNLPVSRERCEEINDRRHSTYAVTTIYFDAVAAQEAEDCINQTRRN